MARKKSESTDAEAATPPVVEPSGASDAAAVDDSGDPNPVDPPEVETETEHAHSEEGPHEASDPPEGPVEPAPVLHTSAPDPAIAAGPGFTDEHSEDHAEDEPGPSFASRVLTGLVILLIGAGIGIWAAPKIAPMLPSGLAPVAAWLNPGQPQTEARIAEIDSRVQTGFAETSARIDSLASASDVDGRIGVAVSSLKSDLESEIAAVRDQIPSNGADTAAQLARLQSAVDGQAAELATIKEQLSGGAAASSQLSADAANRIDVYRAELDGVRAEITSLSDQVSGLSTRVDAAEAKAEREVADARTQATQAQAEASAEVDSAAVQSDVAQIRAAIASGQPFAQPLDRLSQTPDVTVPQGMKDAASSGVATLAELRDRFPDAAHAAIRAGIMASAGDGVLARSRAYLEAQVASRTLTPTPGSSPDAVLSRMEAALGDGDLARVLSESEALPSESKAAMSDWLDMARLRADTESGLTDLSAGLPATN